MLGNPINSLHWLAEQLVEAGGSLKAGEWVSTGSTTTPIPAEAGSKVSATFEDFGSVSVKFV